MQGTFHRNGILAPDTPVVAPASGGLGATRQAASGSIRLPTVGKSIHVTPGGGHAFDCDLDATCNLPYNPTCVYMDLQRPGPHDPSSRIQIVDRPRWASGYLADKTILNAFKMQGALEMQAALMGGTSTAALTKDVGGAQALVSRSAADGTQPLQNYGVYAYNKGVPATAAVSILPSTGPVATGF